MRGVRQDKLNIENIQAIGDSDLLNIELDFDKNNVVMEFFLLNGTTVYIKLNSIVSIKYWPDYTDEPSWMCSSFKVEEIHNIDQLEQNDVLWMKGSPALKELQFPIYKVRASSGDFEFSAVCQDIVEQVNA